MAGNTRGKLKEELEGMHSNLDWLRVHSAKVLALLGDTHPEIQEVFKGLIEEAELLDTEIQKIYGRI